MSEHPLSVKQRLMFFGFALIAMILLATASVAMAARQTTLCIVLYICAVLMIGLGFMMRGRVRRMLDNRK
ncbi:MAG: hypothetical protein JWN30_2621 [Bacilli bacterium]|nr:hypothetical protein [Bacilli bacterium]